MGNKNYLVPVDMNSNQILNFTVQILASAPTARQGGMYYDSTIPGLRYSDGSSWTTLGAGSAYTTENAQDDVAAMIAAGSQSNIAATYNDAGNSITFTVAAGAIVDAQISASAAISADKLASGTTNKVYTATEQTKLAGIASGATAYSDTNARANRLDQFAAPTASVAFNSQKITGLLDPTSPQDAATKAYVDGIASGLDIKESVRAATTAAGTLASSFANGSVIDGVTLATGNRILLKNQASGSENGIYTVNASGAPTRATDADISAEVDSGMFTFVEEGTVNTKTGWILTTTGAITLGTTALTFTQFSGAGTYTNGTGITITGAVIAIDTTVVARKVTATLGDGTTTTFTITHNLGTQIIAGSVVRSTTPWDVVEADIRAATTNTATVTFAVAPTTNQFVAVIIG